MATHSTVYEVRSPQTYLPDIQLFVCVPIHLSLSLSLFLQCIVNTHMYINSLQIKMYTHTYAHTIIHTYIHTYLGACMHAYLHIHVRTCIHTCICTYAHTYIHTCIHRYMCMLAGVDRYIVLYSQGTTHMCIRFSMQCNSVSSVVLMRVPQFTLHVAEHA